MEQDFVQYEQAISRKAVSLWPDVSPYFNIAPTQDLVRKAWAMGLDVVRRPATCQCAEPEAAPRAPAWCHHCGLPLPVRGADNGSA